MNKGFGMNQFEDQDYGPPERIKQQFDLILQEYEREDHANKDLRWILNQLDIVAQAFEWISCKPSQLTA